MKTSTFIQKSKYFISLFICLAQPVWSMTDAEIVEGLEALGQWEMAYPLAYNIAQQENTYAVWRKVATQYAKFDVDDKAYLQTWQQAYTLDKASIYRDFLMLKPQSTLNPHAIHAIFKLTRTSNDISDYLQFVNSFPNTVESVEASLQIHKIAFNQAEKANDPLIYDTFVRAFPGAKQIPQAIRSAFEAEKAIIEMEDDKAKNHGEHEYIARRLYNEARIAENEVLLSEKKGNVSEKEKNTLIVARKYQLLHLERFRNTQVFTELLDREERLIYQKIMQEQQAKIVRSISDMREIVVNTIQQQTQDLGEVLTKQEKHLEGVIAEHNRIMAIQLNEVKADIKKVNAGVELQKSGPVSTDTKVYGSLVGAGFIVLIGLAILL
ncbi:hypothetical protein [Candidatus Parabeggiatoa sp. HSG14]|uniref:hypothetical protein n=1 Tax=Candidatus Parabeggiatoa sp. HSG14 TaxID=3055593 RepID=UPI0025A8300F|nr:hypothetical protein [Thiotrichales bacterium HSG14]